MVMHFILPRDNTYLFMNNRTLDVFCKLGNDIQRNKATIMILAKKAKPVINV